MWYSVEKQTGKIYAVEKATLADRAVVRCYKLDKDLNIDLFGVVYLTEETARATMTKPVRSLDAAVEESIMTCEALYC